MVSDGIYNEGFAEIIFLSGNLNYFADKQILKFYREDKFPLKIF